MNLKTNRKTKFLTLFLSILLLSCEKDFEDKQTTNLTTNPNVKTYFIKGNQARNGASKLSQQFSKTLSNQNTTFRTDSGIIVDYESIMVVENNIEDVAYSFKVDSNQESETTFQNLTLVEKNGLTQTKLITYEMTPEFANLYHADLKDISQFEGNITILDLSENNCCGQNSITIPISGVGDSGSYDNGIGSGGSYGDNGGSSGGWGIGFSSGSGSSGGQGQQVQMCRSGQHVRGDIRCIYTPKESGPNNPVLSNRMTNPNQNTAIGDPRDLCCIFDIGIYEEAHFEKDCEKLKNLSNPTEQNINPEINWLKDKVRANTTLEWGVGFKQENVYNDITNENTMQYTNTQEQGNEGTVGLSVGGFYFGGAHCHTNIGYKTFSFGDLHLFLDMYERASGSRKAKVTYMLVVDNPQDPDNPIVYAITMLNYDAFKQAHDAIWNHPDYAVPPSGNPDVDAEKKIEKIHAVQAEVFEDNKNNLDTYFLQTYGTNFGLSLYKADNDMNNWNKLELGTDSTGNLITQPKPCN